MNYAPYSIVFQSRVVPAGKLAMLANDADLYARILAALIQARTDAGLSRDDVARGLGQPVLFVADYESGAHRLDPAEFIVVARAIGVDPYELLQQVERDDGSSD